MKTCPSCNRTYTDASLNFCLEDGTPLVSSPQPGIDPNATIRYTDPRDTGHPPAEVVRQAAPTYQAPAPTPSHGSQFGQQQRSHLSVPLPPPRKSKAIWWILGSVALVALIGIGAVIMIIAIAGMGSNSDTNANRANVNRLGNRNANANANVSNVNATPSLPSITTDDFSTQNWGTGSYDFGDIWYSGDEYHMRAKADKYMVMYAPSQDYKTGNATVSVMARSVDSSPPKSGFGLIVHGERSRTNQLEDYALLIYTGEEPEYEIVEHKGGKQTARVRPTKSSAIRTGTDANKLEVRARGSELTFYINGQYVDRITDTNDFKGGTAGLYTSGTGEVAFDDLEIRR
ncbi:MAG: hypothetical protein ACRD9S_03320 [Pyrinomonadaceae bacterium]